jgi:hypothetical protein
MERFQPELDQIKTRLAVIESETQDVISQLLARKSEIAAVGKSLTNLSSQCSVLRIFSRPIASSLSNSATHSSSV